MAEINQNSEYGGGAILNRFAISFLSKEYADQALLEEVMIDKRTGEILIKTPNGMVISYDSIARRRSTITDATDCAMTQNMIGNMYELSLEEYDLPAIVPYNENILANSISLKQNLSKVLFYIDIDEIVEGEASAQVSESDPTVEINLRCGTGSVFEEITIEKSLNVFNNTVIKIADYVQRPTSSYNVVLSSIKFKKVGNENVDTFLILHNMMVSIY